MKQPLVSVIMTVYNAQEFLNMAIDSILLQSYTNFELIIIDDGSTDQSPSIIQAYRDLRIKYYRQKNRGLSAALNAGIKKTRGEYIARMDHDDISYPTRLEKQVQYLERNSDVAMLGTSFDFIDEDSGIIGKAYTLDRNQDLKIEFLTRNPFGHGTIMIRRAVIIEIGGYDTTEPIEDYELWWRISKKYKVANLTEFLYGWRIVSSGMSHGGSAKRQDPIAKLMQRIWFESEPPKISIREFKAAIGHYYKLGPQYREQYVYMVCTLVLGLYKMGRPWLALKIFVKLLRVDGALGVLKDLHEHPFSHNYNLGVIDKMTPHKYFLGRIQKSHPR